ncbi:MAG: hypothetical protein IKR57_04520 [Bacilli bacterium]|nr:hypothetical protein [Bacilli bacterium]
MGLINTILNINGIEILIVGVILIFLFNYIGAFSFNKFVDDNKVVFGKLKEDDYDFLCVSRYGDAADPSGRYQARVKNAIITFVVGMIVIITSISGINFPIKLVIVFGITYLVFKDDYSKLKNYYKVHLHDINLKLPYYLKSLEILIQHYTVPVAITRSLEEAPDMFKPGLRDLIAAIDSGDSTIEPYMEFARRYPVRDSMRMMRLLYRLSLGSQERKQEQLIVFSRTISNLQAKSRDTKYKERLDKMEKKTMTMLAATGAGVMIILLLSILQIFVVT